jgi:hypothetical protein
VKRLPSVETDSVQLEIGECDCGFHFGLDVTFMEQVKDFIFICPSCGKEIDTVILFNEDTS